MPEIKNTFIKSKMNKDLDDRLLSKGEYRNAQNVNISRSEGEDVGALENVLGNKFFINAGLTVNSEIIGYIKDDINNFVYTFATDYTDISDDELSNPAPFGAKCQINKIDLANDLNSIIAEGRFLNFSKTHHIYGVNLIEDLLFWTDNRNQPRKVNVTKSPNVAPYTHYQFEDQVSVAKYYPYKAPKLYDQVSVNVKSDVEQAKIPSTVSSADFKNFVTLADVKKLKAGMMLLNGGNSVPSNPGAGLERFIVAVFQGNDSTSYFLTNRRIVTSANTIVAFGYANSKNSFRKYLEYSIIGAAVRYDANVILGLRTISYNSDNESNMSNTTSVGGPDRTLINVPFTTTGSGVNAVINVTISSGAIRDVIVTNPGSGYAATDTIVINAATLAAGVNKFASISAFNVGSGYTVGAVLPVNGGGGSDGTAKVKFNSGISDLEDVGSGYANGSTVTIPVSLGGTQQSFIYNYGSGTLSWLLTTPNFINVAAPTAKTFFWSGSSVPYTKMSVNCPGFTDPDTFITSVAYQGAAPDGVEYYLITTNIDHNIPSSAVVNAVAMVEFSWPNPSYNSAFAGDSDLLKDKFVRFAYRFKFDDGEYSLISPFTQPVFIPEQRGFIQEGVSEVSLNENNTSSGNVTGTAIQNFATGEEDIQASTIVSFFENNVDTIDLQIEMPYQLGDSSQVDGLKGKLAVIEIDILYKESDGLSIKIIDTIPSEIFRLNKDNSVNTSNIFTYKYESKEPFKLVSPTKEIERVFDKVPIRALAQESAGNRIIYGNFIDKHTPPNSLKYNVRVTEKEQPTISNITDPAWLALQKGKSISNSYLSYPTHTVKQNRTYQIGFVLADRYGRQSDVVLSPLDTNQYAPSNAGGNHYDGSTIFNPYFPSFNTRNVATWKGDMLEILLREAIPSTATYADGYPGLYKSGRYDAVVVADATSSTIGFTSLDPNVAIGDVAINTANGERVAVKAVDFNTNELVFSSSVTAFATTTFQIYGPENKLGWYSYKIVVKQLTPDYYNAYLGNVAYLSPNSALASGIGNYPFSGSSFVTSLLSDNVNKIPADLIQVAPEQNQFGTSDALLYPRVGGVGLRDNASIDYIYATNFLFGTQSASINAYGKIRDIGIAELAGTSPNFTGFKTPVQSRGVQSASSDPTAIILTMPNADAIGRAYWRSTGLYIFEVGALESKIEIFWETSTCGLISELNALVAEGPTASIVVPDPPTTPGVPADDSSPTED